ncbi:DUF896 domain-containing protein [Bacillus cereus]|uniref:DUF896 domain-containing protein n=1 Tax=unclassified Bacillus (in: firmicutes) TaxID=185979 RepID=UPI00047E2D8F|nr:MULTISPECIES: DUF896 domain-containing protein [unclassified Bacillus (in: firmicutes)]PFE02890.1 DUF896 domain-containing protein [Bacillus sp. AFS023182]PGX92473.1 DUF896 domain-containing protein [Bacillus cereus]
MKHILFRINELAKKERISGLQEIEKQEQQMLRQSYMKEFRGSLDSILLNTTIVDPNGENVTPLALQHAQNRMNVKK